MEECMFRNSCKNSNTELCNELCYPYVLLHGRDGKKGFYGLSGVPRSYKKVLLETLPIQAENPKAYSIIKNYIEKIIPIVEEKGLGLFLYSIPNKDNLFGTGTGKTTSAVAILNTYIIEATRQHLKGIKRINKNPALFVKASTLQNIYNAQFRGTMDKQQEASNKFYSLKAKMENVDLLVIDDIAIRDTTEAFKNELYEILDYRATESKATIFTSNIPLSELNKYLGERIVSRIEGMAMLVEFYGADHRKGGLW